MHGLLLSSLLALAADPAADLPDCPPTAFAEPGRWRVESVREGEPPARGIADIVRWEGGCVLLERLLIHFDDGTSHHLVFVHGAEPDGGAPRLLQIGDHPLFLLWRGEAGGRTYRTERPGAEGTVELRWRIRRSEPGFERELQVRPPGGAWRSDEVVRYTPVRSAVRPAELPARRPGPFHDPDACAAPPFREMDHLLGHWLGEEWRRGEDGWTTRTVSHVSVRPVIGGCALLGEHPVYENGSLTDRRLVVRGYDPDQERWRQVVFGHGGGVREWGLEETGGGWILTPERGGREGRLRIVERADSTGLVRRTQALSDDGSWHTRRRIRYVAW